AFGGRPENLGSLRDLPVLTPTRTFRCRLDDSVVHADHGANLRPKPAWRAMATSCARLLTLSLLGDTAVIQALGDEFQHVPFARGEVALQYKMDYGGTKFRENWLRTRSRDLVLKTKKSSETMLALPAIEGQGGRLPAPFRAADVEEAKH